MNATVSFKIVNVPADQVANLKPDFLASGTHVEAKTGGTLYLSGSTRVDGQVIVRGVAHNVPAGAILVDQNGRGGGRKMFIVLSRDNF